MENNKMAILWGILAVTADKPFQMM